jgi:predicted GIY-YIG superfamily endonuclease
MIGMRCYGWSVLSKWAGLQLSPRSLCGEADQPNSRLADTQDKRRKAQHRRGIGGRLTVGKGCAKIFILWRQAEINRAISETYCV